VRGPGDKDHPAEGVTLTVNVTGEDLTGVMLVAGSGGTLSGRVVSDTGAPIPFPEQSRMRVSARPVDPTTTYTSFDNDNGRVKDDWTFELTNAYGLNKILIGPLPTGWALKSIDYGGKDFADLPMEFHGGQRLDSVTITLSKTLPRIQGTLQDDTGRPAEGSVLIFPEDSAKWTEEARLVRSARPDESGAFEFRNVIPGSYLAAALDYVRDGEWADPDFLAKLRDQAKPVRVDETGVATVALTLKRQ
jgi:hypothetical protein